MITTSAYQIEFTNILIFEESWVELEMYHNFQATQKDHAQKNCTEPACVTDIVLNI